MHPIRKILVPIDFSPHAEEAIAWAVDLSKRYDATITLVHVYQAVAYALPDAFVLYTPARLTEMLLEFERQLDVAKAFAQAEGADQVETQMRAGIAVAEIVQCAKEGPFDVIVMGTHGRTGLQHALMGSVAERVIRTAPCPVLVIRTPT